MDIIQYPKTREQEAQVLLNAKADFASVANDPEKLLRQLMIYVDVADRHAQKGMNEWVAGFLRGCGYKDGAHIGKPQDTLKDPKVLTEYIFGQYLNSISKLGLCPPNPMDRFGREALKLFAKQK